MIDGLIAGKVYGQPQQRTGKSGKRFTTAKIRAATGNGESMFVNVIAFDTAAQAAMLTLGDGDSAALAGSLTPTAWTDKEGQPRPSLDMIAASVMTPYQLAKRRKAAEPTKPAHHQAAPPASLDDDDLDF